VSLDENALSRRRAELERSGAHLIDLTEWNPTTAGLSDYGVTLPAVDRYAPDPLGLRSAREAIGRYANVSADQLLLSASTSEAYAWLFKLLGGEALVPAPCYPLLDHLAALERVTLRRYPLRYDGRWCTDAPVVADAGSAATRAVIAVSPGNPTGSYLAEDEAGALAALCARRGWALIIDEVFAAPARALTREWPCLTFVLGGLSKACGLPQLKLAWTSTHGPGAGPALERLAFIADTYLSVSSPVQAAAQELLSLAPAFQQRVGERCARNRALLQLSIPSDWQLLGAEGGWSGVLRVPQALDEETRCLELLERGVAVHPGYFYDFPAGAHLVVSLLPRPEQLVEGLKRLCSP
jgi:aspartate/methionine/tyrosine aminotransferase